MKKYYKQLNESGEVVLLLEYNFEPKDITDPLVVEITESEYESLRAEILAQIPKIEYEPSEMELKAKAYDILTGVSE
jgi:hypothetical protein